LQSLGFLTFGLVIMEQVLTEAGCLGSDWECECDAADVKVLANDMLLQCQPNGLQLNVHQFRS